MTDDDTERRNQLLKVRLRVSRALQRLGEKLRPSTPEASDQRWKNQQSRWAAEDELDREEEAAAAAARRQQESAAPPVVDPPEPELREAPEAEIKDAIKEVYSRTPEGRGPNVNEVIVPVQAVLKTKGFKTSGRRIREFAEDEQFTKYRGQPGVRRQS
jgi:hypothetical protein